ncbi:phospholipase D-like domain-containing protein [Desulfobacter curvatus]|uniref:phospholipase D-like domain-containing protein n=1 Tax=Desulfobacter curvatus TaxID=2290 RepID=UPI0003815AB2|nr:phospholipase D-like domain-containing protein [Desulfobacter curvatus]
MKKVLTAVFTIFCAMIILATVQTAIAATFENGKIEVYISTHKDLSQENYVLETEIIRFIDESKVSLNIAVQELRSGKIYSGNPIKEAVQRAAARGVKVNLILEKSYLKPDTDNQKTFDEFQAADNIQVKADGNPAIFHDKFIVRDYDEPGAALLTGSTNFTDTGTRRNYNHIIILHFPNTNQKNYGLLRAYRDEFNELWNGIFGNKNDGQMGSFQIGNTRFKVLFSPDNDPDDYLLETVVGAKETLDIMMFTFGPGWIQFSTDGWRGQSFPGSQICQSSPNERTQNKSSGGNGAFTV